MGARHNDDRERGATLGRDETCVRAHTLTRMNATQGSQPGMKLGGCEGCGCATGCDWSCNYMRGDNVCPNTASDAAAGAGGTQGVCGTRAAVSWCLASCGATLQLCLPRDYCARAVGYAIGANRTAIVKLLLDKKANAAEAPPRALRAAPVPEGPGAAPAPEHGRSRCPATHPRARTWVRPGTACQQRWWWWWWRRWW